MLAPTGRPHDWLDITSRLSACLPLSPSLSLSLSLYLCLFVELVDENLRLNQHRTANAPSATSYQNKLGVVLLNSFTQKVVAQVAFQLFI